MKNTIFTIIENRPLVPSIFRMKLYGDTSAIHNPGEFVNIRLHGFYLRRPISVCCVNDGVLTLIYKVVGAGTEAMSELSIGDPLELLTGLGNGYDLSASGARPLLIGGGVGVPPLYELARRLTASDRRVSVVLGFNRADEVFYEHHFSALGCDVTVTTVDGSYGVRGYVTDALPDDYTYFYACGPLPMLKAAARSTVTAGEMSFEERMGCGFGACMGCTVRTKNGSKRVCKDGPVLRKEEILWDD